MKSIYYFIMLVTIVSVTACGSTKKLLESQNQMLMQQMQQQKQPEQPDGTQQRSKIKQPSRTMREKDPCTIKAEEPSGNLRVVGIARSYNESSLRMDAINNAQIQMAQLISVSIEGAINDYNANATANTKLSSKGIVERTMDTYIIKEIENTRVIESAVYDLSDGSIQMFVCLEMGNSIDNLVSEIDDVVLNDDEVIGIKYDRELFKKSVAEGLAEYKNTLKNR